MLPSFQENIIEQRNLFHASLEEDRPQFIDYFLSAGFDPLTLVEAKVARANTFREFILKLYQRTYGEMATVCYSAF